MRLPLFIAVVVLLTCAGCANMRRDVSEIDPYASYSSDNGDDTVTMGGRILFRDPGLKK